jgi:hypothetical protein
VKALIAQFERLAPDERLVIEAVIEAVGSLDGLKCAFWGGSTRFLSKRRPWSDIDLWVVLDQIDDQPAVLGLRLKQIKDVRLVHEIGHLPWFGHLFSLFFFPGCTFAVDVGLCTKNDVPNLNPGQDPLFFLGSDESIHDVRSALRPQTYVLSQRTRAETLLAHLLKMRKSLARNHLWNAMECLTRARRELLGLLLDGRGKRVIHYGRADRDAEDHLEIHECKLLATTAAHYKDEEIRRAAGIVASYAADSGLCPQEIEIELRLLAEALLTEPEQGESPHLAT